MTPLLKGNMLKKHTEPSELNLAITRIFERMEYVDPESDEYGVLVSRLDRLHSMKIAERNDRSKVSYDAMLTAGASILGILLVINHERLNVITTKALGFVTKPKL